MDGIGRGGMRAGRAGGEAGHLQRRQRQTRGGASRGARASANEKKPAGGRR